MSFEKIQHEEKNVAMPDFSQLAESTTLGFSDEASANRYCIKAVRLYSLNTDSITEIQHLPH